MIMNTEVMAADAAFLPEMNKVEARDRGLDLESCNTLFRTNERTIAFGVTAEELRSLAFQYLDRYYQVQAVCITISNDGWEVGEEAFAWHRFSKIAEVLYPDGLPEEFVSYIAERDAEMLQLEEDYASHEKSLAARRHADEVVVVGGERRGGPRYDLMSGDDAEFLRNLAKM